MRLWNVSGFAFIGLLPFGLLAQPQFNINAIAGGGPSNMSGVPTPSTRPWESWWMRMATSISPQ